MESSLFLTSHHPEIYTLQLLLRASGPIVFRNRDGLALRSFCMTEFSKIYVYENPTLLGPTYLPYTIEEEQKILRRLREGRYFKDKLQTIPDWLKTLDRNTRAGRREWELLYGADEQITEIAPPDHQELAQRRQEVIDALAQSQAWRDGINVRLDEDRMVRSGFVPENEMEVIMLFSKIDLHLGLRPMRMKVNQYPDAIYEKPDGSRLFVEFEYRSSNFVSHGHDATKTDLVICWQRDRDLAVPVIELQHAYNPEEISFDMALLSPL